MNNMAKGRVGGTKAKIRGQVGNTIYQLKRAEDGSYTQHSYAKGERVESQPSSRLQAHRMCMAMVESLMKDLKPITAISFESGETEGQSINAFSSKNVALVVADCRAHWYEGNLFVYPYHHRSDIETRDLGGVYMLSNGSGPDNLFNEDFWSDYAARDFQNIHDQAAQFFGIRFDCVLGMQTLAQFMKAHHMTRQDAVVFCFFREWIDYTNPDDPQEYQQHEYCIAQLNPSIPDDAVLTSQIAPYLFVTESSVPCVCLAARDSWSVALGRLTDPANSNEAIYYQAGFSISYYTGKKRITTSVYHNPDGCDDPWLEGRAPADVFASWMESETRGRFPSPYGTKK